MKTEIINFLLAITSYQLRTNPENANMTEEKYERNRVMNSLYLEAIAELLELLPEEERKKVPKSVAMDERAFREWFHMETNDLQVDHDKYGDRTDILHTG